MIFCTLLARELTLVGIVDPEKVFIRTEDLRAQCRAASNETKPDNEEPSKSPKKKLFGVSLPTFSRTSATTPAMSSKAAQVLGTSSTRKPRYFEPRPIKSARVLKTPTKAPRSDTAKSLPGKVYDQHPARVHHRTSSRRNHTIGHRSPGMGRKQPKGQATASASFESMPPPTPPMKDTPPEVRHAENPPSPLRRAPSNRDLRESFGNSRGKGLQLDVQFPKFALSPSPPKTAIHGQSVGSPTKIRSYTAEDYTRLIEGEALQWPYPEDNGLGEVKEGGRSAPLSVARDVLPLPLSSRSDTNHYNERLGRRLSPLPPRFYSPSDRSVQLFKDGESPSQNVSDTRSFLLRCGGLRLTPTSRSRSAQSDFTATSCRSLAS